MSCPKVIKVVLPGPPGPIGTAQTIAANSVLGRGSGTGTPVPLPLGPGLAVVNGQLVATATGSGTGTSVAMTVPTGFSVAGSPITTSGTLAIVFAAGYSLPSTAKQGDWDAGAALAATAVQPGDSRLSDSREWSAATVTQAEAEAGVATTRRAFTALRVFQAAAAWWQGASTDAGRALVTAVNDAAQRTALGLGSAATAASTDFATAAQGGKADTAVQPGDPALSDAREWNAATITQAEAEAGAATTRRAFTAQRVFQAVAAWWAGSSNKTKLDGIAAGATANSSDAQLRDRGTHTGTQSAETITGLATVATSGAYGDLSGRPVLGTAAAQNVGAGAGNVVQLNENGKLPEATVPLGIVSGISIALG